MRRASDRMLILMALVGAIALFALLARPNTVAALPDYAAKTGQPCSTCHVNPAGGGALTPTGLLFQAIPNHAADPSGAFTQATSQARPAPTAAPPPTTPSTTTPAAPTTPSTTTPSTTTPAAPSTSTLPRAGDALPLGMLAAAGFMLVVLGLVIRRATAFR